MSKCKVGDRVICTESSLLVQKGAIGTIVGKGNNTFEVKFETLDLIDSESDSLFISCDRVKLYTKSIHITQKGNECHAVLKENDKVVKRAKAICNPQDEFDFEVGSKIAYDRLFNIEPNKKVFNINDYNRNTVMWCNTVEKAREFELYLHSLGKKWTSGLSYLERSHSNEYEGFICYNFCDGQFSEKEWFSRIECECCTILNYDDFEFVKKKEFVPYLVYETSGYGNIGKETNLTALRGESLYVGDVVRCYQLDTNEKFDAYVIEKSNHYGIMGLHDLTKNLKNGIVEEYQIEKIKSYSELRHNEMYSVIKAILHD